MCVRNDTAMPMVWSLCQPHQERSMVNSGQFEETIHKSNWVDLTPSAFSYAQYQLPITEVMEVELPYTSSITEAGVSLYVMDNKRQVASCCRYSIQPAVMPNRSVSINACAHTHAYTACIYFACSNLQSYINTTCNVSILIVLHSPWPKHSELQKV